MAEVSSEAMRSAAPNGRASLRAGFPRELANRSASSFRSCSSQYRLAGGWASEGQARSGRSLKAPARVAR
jgi:hypothetical protein